MFTISLYLDDYPTCSGCRALDFRRLWGLPERPRVVSSYRPGEHLAREWPVGEAFARAHFAPEALQERQRVPLFLLRPGELVEAKPFSPGDTPDLQLSEALTAERAEELFVAARAYYRQAALLAETMRPRPS